MNPKHFEGRPCPQCGSTTRYRSVGCCVPCRNARTRAWNKAEYAADPEIQRRRSSKWRAANREKERARYQRWVAANPDKRRATRNSNNQKRHRAEGDLTQDDIDRLFDEQGGRCAYFDLCGTNLGQDFQCDHIVPIAAGGPDHAWNRQLLCQPCNLRKGQTDPIKFAERNGLDPRRALQAFSRMGQFSRP
jgi:5-methylcytosine-specific restriction endonuclease McrA